eukprot:tig00020539_g10405.t1
MESCELISLKAYPTSAFPTAKEGGVRVGTFHAVKSRLDVGMTPHALRAISGLREDAVAALRRHDRKGYALLTAYVEDEGGVAVTHVILARDARDVPPPKPRAGGGKRGGTKGDDGEGNSDS